MINNSSSKLKKKNKKKIEQPCPRDTAAKFDSTSNTKTTTKHQVGEQSK